MSSRRSRRRPGSVAAEAESPSKTMRLSPPPEEEKTEYPRLEGCTIICGGGGGGDAFDALTVAEYLRHVSGVPRSKVVLASMRPCELKNVTGLVESSIPGIYWVTPATRFNNKGRYFEHLVERSIGEPVLYLVADVDGRPSPDHIREQVVKLQSAGNRVIFIDSGGDAITLSEEDIPGSAQDKLYEGQDAAGVEAVKDLENVYLGVVCLGADIKRDRALGNLEKLRGLGAYYGHVDMRTGKQTELGSFLDTMFPNRPVEKKTDDGDSAPWLRPFFDLTDKILVSTLDQLAAQKKERENGLPQTRVPSKMVSLFRRALKWDLGPDDETLVPTFVSWGNPDGDPCFAHYSQLHFVDMTKVRGLKEPIE